MIIHHLPADIRHIIILLILIILVLIICVLLCLHQLFVRQQLLPHLHMLLVALTIIGDGNCLDYFVNLDIDQATGFDRGLPRLALCRPASVFTVVVLL